MRRRKVDFEAIRKELAGDCFICELVNGNTALYGYVLVAPKEHREQVTGDSSTEYVRLQQVVHRVGEAVRSAVPTERLYVLSLGSQQGNRHVHWHIAPLPPGVPFELQQLAALDTNLCLDLSEEQSAELAQRIRLAVSVTS